MNMRCKVSKTGLICASSSVTGAVLYYRNNKLIVSEQHDISVDADMFEVEKVLIVSKTARKRKDWSMWLLPCENRN